MSEALDKKWQLIKELMEEMRERSEKTSELCKTLSLDFESPLVTPIFEAEDATIRAISMLLGDQLETLDWFVYECDYGRKEMEAGKGDDMRKICTYEDLRWLIELNTEGEGR